MIIPIRVSIVAILLTLFVASSGTAEVPGYPTGVSEASYRSDGDGSMQPTLVWFPDSDKPVPLLVALHTWSSDYRQQGGEVQYARWCQQAGWAFIHPNFRGINKTAEALGSDLAVADIRSAVEYAKETTAIDTSRIYCVGVSGGGHASMLVAAREPDLWAGVSAWCGISDIESWYRQCDKTQFERYARMIESSLGGSLYDSKERQQDAYHRSPLKWIRSAERLPPIDLNHGINDGREGSVPFTHSIHAWNAAVPDAARIPEAVVDEFYETRIVPEAIAKSNLAGPDPLFGSKRVIDRRVAGNVRLTIFDGGHEIVHEAALNWLAAQAKGQPVDWNPKRAIAFEVRPIDRASGK